MIAWMCGLPGLILFSAGTLVCSVSYVHAARVQALSGVLMCGLGALGIDSALHGYASQLIAWPMVAASLAVGWLVFVPHQSPQMQRWSVSSRGRLDNIGP